MNVTSLTGNTKIVNARTAFIPLLSLLVKSLSVSVNIKSHQDARTLLRQISYQMVDKKYCKLREKREYYTKDNSRFKGKKITVTEMKNGKVRVDGKVYHQNELLVHVDLLRTVLEKIATFTKDFSKSSKGNFTTKCVASMENIPDWIRVVLKEHSFWKAVEKFCTEVPNETFQRWYKQEK